MVLTEQIVGNLIIAVAGMIICCFSILILLIGGSKDKRSVRYLTYAFISMLIYNAALTYLELAIRFHPAPENGRWRASVIVMGFCTFLFSVISAFIVSRYMIYILGPPMRVQLRLRTALIGVGTLYIIVLLFLQFTGRLVQVDSAGVYSEGGLSFIGTLTVAVFMLVDLVLLLRYRKNLSRTQRIAFAIFYGLPMLSTLTKPLLGDIYIVAFASNLAGAIMMVIIMKGQNEELRRQELHNEQLKVDILLGQIQPHFLFNVLYVIQEICHEDPEKASEAIGEFSRYLRHNMDSLSINSPIPFKEELEHTKHYVSLQHLRFGDSLDVRYELGCTDFYLPTLTLQPIVENAVRYGVRKKSSGKGSIVVRTYEFEDRYEIEVTDDGPGFDQSLNLQDGMSHVGLSNVRQRLRRISGGDLEIHSEIGKGTTVRIKLPKDR